jgi:hypothetical protein
VLGSEELLMDEPILPRHMLPPDSDKMPDCRCATWTYASEMGEWKDHEHHPRCPEGHDRKTCRCFNCLLRRGEAPKSVWAKGVNGDDTE